MNKKRLFTRSSKIAIFLSGMLFLVGCAQREAVEDSDKTIEGLNAEIQEPSPIQEDQKILPRSSTVPQLGNLCSGEEECIAFCQNNPGQCEEYCKGNSENELCKLIFPPEEERKQTEKQPEMKPVLKNLGINIEAWNKETNLAGDFTFTKKLVFNDGFINNEKVFAEFGEFEHLIKNPERSVEYWFFLSPGTKIHAPIDGIVSVGFFEHTQDWGVNIMSERFQFNLPRGSSLWNVAFEHLANLKVKEGDIVKAGDVIGEAAPRNFFGEDLSFTEFAVWTGGDHIYKFCPFEFLDESLKPVYEEKLNQLAKDWEEFIGKDVYKQEDWVAPGCLLHNITER